MAPSFQTAHLDELDSIPGPGSLTWHPVRSHFDIRAFGCNAYSAKEAGQHVVEPHDEAPEAEGEVGHQELYFVAIGLADFTIDGETFEAPAGTYVWLPDPASRREAVAREAGTTVLSFGGPPTFEPSEWEFRWKAMRLIDSDPAEARRLLDEGMEVVPHNTGLRLGLAELALAQGERARALEILTRVVSEDPDAREWVGEGSFPRLLADPETASAAGQNPES